MNAYDQLKNTLESNQSTWLITGVAGFIGSNLLETLLDLKQKVIGLDNFSTGHQHNLDKVQAMVGGERWRGFTMHSGDIRNLADWNLRT